MHSQDHAMHDLIQQTRKVHYDALILELIPEASNEVSLPQNWLVRHLPPNQVTKTNAKKVESLFGGLSGVDNKGLSGQFSTTFIWVWVNIQIAEPILKGFNLKGPELFACPHGEIEIPTFKLILLMPRWLHTGRIGVQLEA
ncbi:conserved hypothetical protein [Ricinus communis]|uniref:Uncharacterized protein n=1 Tax=Ricinus communis TaxID=3988 RepID=B9S5G4_RICCO|nr:conserved hypothetical protein [Ricinus communis]